GYAGLGGAQNGCGRIHVVAAYIDRTANLFDRHNGAERHHLAVGVSHLQKLDPIRIVAELAVGLHDHLPTAAEAIEIIDIKRAQILLERVEDVLRVYSHRLALIAVDVRIKLRHIGTEDTDQPLDLVALFRARDDSLDLLLQLFQSEIGAVLNNDLEAAGRAKAGHWRRRRR